MNTFRILIYGRARRGLQTAFAFLTALVLVGCNGGSESVENMIEDYSISSSSDKRLVPSSDGSVVSYTLTDENGLPIRYRDVTLEIDGNASFSRGTFESQSTVSSEEVTSEEKETEQLTVKTDANGVFKAVVYTTTTGEFVLRAYVDKTLLMQENYVVNNVNANGTPAIEVSRLEVVSDVNSTIGLPLSGVIEIAQIEAFDSFGNKFSGLRADDFTISLDESLGGSGEVLLNPIEKLVGSDTVYTVSLSLEDTQIVPEENVLTITYHSSQAGLDLSDENREDPQVKVNLRFEAMSQEFSISSNSVKTLAPSYSENSVVYTLSNADGLKIPNRNVLLNLEGKASFSKISPTDSSVNPLSESGQSEEDYIKQASVTTDENGAFSIDIYSVITGNFVLNAYVDDKLVIQENYVVNNVNADGSPKIEIDRLKLVNNTVSNIIGLPQVASEQLAKFEAFDVFGNKFLGLSLSGFSISVDESKFGYEDIALSPVSYVPNSNSMFVVMGTINDSQNIPEENTVTISYDSSVNESEISTGESEVSTEVNIKFEALAEGYSISSIASKRLLPSNDANSVNYTLINSDELRISHQDVVLKLEGEASFSPLSSVEKNSATSTEVTASGTLVKQLTVTTDANGDFNANIYSVKTGEFSLLAYIDDALILNDSYEVSNVNSDGTPAVKVERLELSKINNAIETGLPAPIEIAEVKAVDVYGNTFKGLNSRYLTVSIDDSKFGYEKVSLSPLSQRSETDGTFLVKVLVDETDVAPEENVVTITYHPALGEADLSNSSGNEVQAQFTITFKTMGATTSSINEFIESNSVMLGGDEGVVSLVQDDTGNVVAMSVYDPSTKQTAEVKNLEATADDTDEIVSSMPDELASQIDVDNENTTVTVVESTVKNDDDIVLSTTVMSTIDYIDTTGVVQSVSVEQTVKDSGSIPVTSSTNDESLSLLDDLTGKYQEKLVTLPDGSMTTETTVISQLEDGSVITAEYTSTTDGQFVSENETLSGEIEAISAIKADSAGNVLSEQSLVTGKNEDGNDVVIKTNFSAEASTEEKSEVISKVPSEVSSNIKVDDENTTIKTVVSTTKDENDNVLSTSVISTVNYIDEQSNSQSASVVQTVKESGSIIFKDTSNTDGLPLLEELEGEVDEKVVTLPDGTVNTQTKVTNTQADGSTIAATHITSTAGQLDSENGQLKGEVETVTVTKSDSGGNILSEQSLTTGQNDEGNQVVVKTNFDAQATAEEKSKVVEIVPSEISSKIDVADNNTTIKTVETTVRDENDNVLSTSVTSTVYYEDADGKSQSVSVVQTVKDSGGVVLQSTEDSSLPLLEDLSGKVEETVVIYPDGTTNTQTTVTNKLEDGSVVSAIQTTSSQGLVSSESGELNGEVEAVTVTKTDNAGNVLSEQTLTTGRNEAGDEVSVKTSFSVEATTEEKAEVVKVVPAEVSPEINIDDEKTTIKIVQSTVKDEDNNVLSTSVTSTINYVNEEDESKVVSVTETVKENGSVPVTSNIDEASLSLLEDLTGKFEEKVVTLPDGTINSETTVKETLEDGAVISATYIASTAGQVDSLNGELKGEIETVTVTKTDIAGKVVTEQSLTTGQNQAGNEVSVKESFESSATLEVDGVTQSGEVTETTVAVTNDDGDVTTENLAILSPSKGGDLVVTPPSLTIESSNFSESETAEQNIPLNGNASESAVNALAQVFERNYGVDFDAWNVNKRVVTYIMRDVMDYNTMLTTLKDKEDGSLKAFMQNYPMSSSNGFMTLLTIAGQNRTMLMIGNKDSTTKKEVVFESRPKEWRYMVNIGAEENGFLYSRYVLLSLEDGRTYIINNGSVFDLADSISEASLDNSAYAKDADGNIYLKNVTSMGFAARQEISNLQYETAVLLIQPDEGDKQILCVALNKTNKSNQCPTLNSLNDGSVVWLDLFSGLDSEETKELATTVEGEFGNTVYAINDQGSYYLKGQTYDFYDGVQLSKSMASGTFDSESGKWLKSSNYIYVYGQQLIGFNNNGSSISLDKYSVSDKEYQLIFPVKEFTDVATVDQNLKLTKSDGDIIYVKSEKIGYVKNYRYGYPSHAILYPTVVKSSSSDMYASTAYLTASITDKFRNQPDSEFNYLYLDTDGKELTSTTASKHPYLPAIDLDAISPSYRNLCVLDYNEDDEIDFSLCSERYVLGVEEPSKLPTVIQRFVNLGQEAGWKRNTHWSTCKDKSSGLDTSGNTLIKAYIPCDYDGDGSSDDGFKTLPYSTNGDTSDGKSADENFVEQVFSIEDAFGYYLPIRKIWGTDGTGDISEYEIWVNYDNPGRLGVTPLVYVLSDGGIFLGVDYLSIIEDERNVQRFITDSGYDDASKSHDPRVVLGDMASEYSDVAAVFADLLSPAKDVNSIMIDKENPIDAWAGYGNKAEEAFNVVSIYKDDKKYTIRRSNSQSNAKGNNVITSVTVNKRTDGYVVNEGSSNVITTLLERWNTKYNTNYKTTDIVEEGNRQWSFRFDDGSLALFDTLKKLDPNGSEALPLEKFSNFVGKPLLSSLRLDGNFFGLNAVSVLKFENGLYWPYAKADKNTAYEDSVAHSKPSSTVSSLRKYVTYFLDKSVLKVDSDDNPLDRTPDMNVIDSLNDSSNDYWKVDIYGLHTNPNYAFGSPKRVSDSVDYYLSFYANKNALGYYDFNVFSTIDRTWLNSSAYSSGLTIWSRIPTGNTVTFFDSDGGNRFYNSSDEFVVDNVISVTPHLGYWVTALAFYHYDSESSSFETQLITTSDSDYHSNCLSYVLGKGSSCEAVVALTD